MKRKMIFSAMLAALAFIASAYDVKNPALVPVRFKEAPRHEALGLVEKGELRFAIITDKNAEKQRRWREEKSIAPAVELLQEAFEKCTGKKPEVFDVAELEKAKSYPLRIWVGENALTKKLGLDALSMPNQGYEVKTFPNGLAIVGNDSSLIENYPKDSGALRGTLWGAYDFAERFLGCRFFYPGELGSLWPKTDSLSILPVNYTDSPRFLTRDPCWITWSMGDLRKTWEPILGPYRKGTFYPDSVPFFERWRMAKATPFWAGHNPRPERFLKSYPDKKELIFYKAPNGNLYYNSQQHIGNYYDVTNLRFADLLVESLKKYYASGGRENDGWEQLNRFYIPFGQCDSDVPLPDMINNPTVVREKLITEENIKRGDVYSDIYGRFYQYLGERMKKEFPDKKLILLPYSNYTQAPLNPKWKLPDNIELRVCFYGMDKIRNPEVAAKWLKLVKEWSEAQQGRPVASLWLYNVPRFQFARAIAPSMAGDVAKLLGKYLGDNDLFLDQYGTLEWWYYYSNYAAVRSMWNPAFNVQAAMDEHWTPFYGKAGPYLKEFYDLLLESYLKYYVSEKERNALYPAPVLNRLEALLKQAEKSLPPDSVEMKRFRLFATPWPKAIEAMRNRMAYERPVYGVHQLLASEKITVDGHADEAVWAKIRALPLRDPGGTNDKPKFPAILKLAWDKQGIYGLAEMKHVPLADPKKSVWDNDSLEILLSPSLKGANLYHYALDPVGNLHFGTKEYVPVEKPYNSHWKSPGFKSAVKKDADSWRVEFFIPYEDLKVKTPAAYDSWLLNLVRNKKSIPKEYSGTSMTLGNNHNIGMFGIMKFLGKGE